MRMPSPRAPLYSYEERREIIRGAPDSAIHALQLMAQAQGQRQQVVLGVEAVVWTGLAIVDALVGLGEVITAVWARGDHGG